MMKGLREAVARGVSAVPLRIMLVVAMIGLTGLVLLASGAVLTSAMARSLTDRVDEQLFDAAHSWAGPRPMKQISTGDGNTTWVPAELSDPVVPPPLPSGEQPRRFYELRKNRAGNVFFEIPGSVDGSASTPATSDTPGPVTVDSSDSTGVRWRVLTTTNEYGTVTIGLPLDENQRTVTGLVLIEVFTGAAALLVLAVLGYLVVRRSLRPLHVVEETAAAIAAGDMHRRVPVRGVDTEVDHLAQSFNVMLSKIQLAVGATEASEEHARRSEARMRRFVADAGHELRTPLTTIRGFAELYRQGASTDAGALLARVETEAQRMGLMVEDLLMLARLDNDRPLDRAPVDMLAVAAEVVHNAAAVAVHHKTAPDEPDRRVGLDVDGSAGALIVLGDAARLHQVLTNLVTNALHHTPPGTPVFVRLSSGGDDVHIDVVDSGPGLSAEDADRVFERFYRADSSRNRARGGAGLGLAIVQALVLAHGGRIGVGETPGGGATFSVALPRERPGDTAG
ncbi:sensor histidine kinase [Nocardia sp. NPDC001965]